MKSMEELATIRKKVEELRQQLRQLTPDELAQVTGGLGDGMIFVEPTDVSDDTGKSIIPGR